MADADKRIDPFDVAALEKSLNDSATRVSTIWVSFLIFSLYLLTAAATVTHRQLFLAEPVKLPVLNIDLPLWGFFFLAPILFVILHAYVLIQVILLGRTAAAYDDAVNERIHVAADSARVRQRLANTLFAQIFAGSPREREGAFGWLLRAMAWITLAISPILILLTFQFMFLPYHSHLATWTHRLLILLELVVAFRLWPLVLDPQRDFHWPHWRAGIREIATRLRALLPRGTGRVQAWQGLRRQTIPLATFLMFILLSLLIASFPGEPHVNLLTGQQLDAVQCYRWLQRDFGSLDLRVDRLSLPGVDVVDDEKLVKITKATSDRGLREYEGERTREFRKRDFACGNLGGADLRRVDLTKANLSGADLAAAALEGALLFEAVLESAHLTEVQLQKASLSGAKLQGADLQRARLQETSLYQAQLQGALLGGAIFRDASLDGAAFQGASFVFADLDGQSLTGLNFQGASFERARLRGASLRFANLEGSNFESAWLEGASLDGARLQGASLKGANLSGALLKNTALQGASLVGVRLEGATFIDAWVWRTNRSDCSQERISGAKPDAVITWEDGGGGSAIDIEATPENVRKFISTAVANIPSAEKKREVSARMVKGLQTNAADTAALTDRWVRCGVESANVTDSSHIELLVATLRNLACDTRRNGGSIGDGVATNWLQGEDVQFDAKLARAMLGEDGKPCVNAESYSEWTKARLRRALAR